MPIINPNQSPTTGTAVGRGTLDPNNPYNGATGHDGLLQWMTWEKQHNPNYQLPNGYTMESGGVVRDQPGFLMRNPWLIPLLGVGAGFAAAALAGGGAASAVGGMYAAGGPEAGGAASSAVGASVPAVAGGTAAATGGTASSLAPWLKTAQAVGSAAGAIGQARAQGRLTDIAAADAAARLPAQRAHNAVTGDILSNAKDFSYGAPTMVGNIPVPTSTGGLRPSILSPTTRALGSSLTQQASSQQGTDNFGPSALDKILGVAGTIGGLATAIPDAQSLGPSSSIPYRRPGRGTDSQGRMPGEPGYDWQNAGIG